MGDPESLMRSSVWAEKIGSRSLTADRFMAVTNRGIHSMPKLVIPGAMMKRSFGVALGALAVSPENKMMTPATVMVIVTRREFCARAGLALLALSLGWS